VVDYKAELHFVEYSIKSYLECFYGLAAKGNRHFLIQGVNSLAREFLNHVLNGEKKLSVKFYTDVKKEKTPIPENVESSYDIDQIEVIFNFMEDEENLSTALMGWASISHCKIYAPITGHYCKNRPVFINSIPKGGTHLLFECVRAMGFEEPPTLDLPDNKTDFTPGHFYNLQHAKRECFSQQYINIYNFINAFANSVVLFIYRDPRDIAVSLAYYLASQHQYHILSEYMEGLSSEDRLLCVIQGRYPLPVFFNRDLSFEGDIRELINTYLDWIVNPFPNTLVIRFEDLIGAEGGGDRLAQVKAIWRIQLALHVGGTPEEYCGKIFSPQALTFRKGQIGDYKKEFTEKVVKEFQDLPQDFMEQLRYSDQSLDEQLGESLGSWGAFKGKIPLTAKMHSPVLIERDFQGYNLIYFNGHVYAVSQNLGELDLRLTPPEKITELKNKNLLMDGKSLGEVKEIILNLPPEVVKQFAHMRFLEEGVDGYNIFEFGRCYYAINQNLGPLDLSLVEQNKLEALKNNSEVLVGHSVAEIKRMTALVSTLIHWISDNEGNASNEKGVANVRFRPCVVAESLDGFNIIQFRGIFYIVAQGLENFDIENLDSEKIFNYQSKNQLLVGQTLKQAKEIIKIVSSNSLKYDFTGKPKIVEEGHQGFNIVQYKSVFYVIAQRVSIDVEQLTSILIVDFQSKFQLAVASSLEQAKELTGFLLSRKSQVETDEMRRNRVNERWKKENEILNCKAQDLEIKVTEYENSLEELKEIGARKEQQLKEFETKLEKQSRQIQELEQALKAKETETLSLVASGKNKDQEIILANKELARLTRRMDEYKKQVNWDVERIESLVKMVCTKNEEIIRLNEAIR